MIYAVGDRVIVRDDLIEGTRCTTESAAHPTESFVGRMSSFCGEVVTIDTVHEDLGKYKIKEDSRVYWWTATMFAGLEESDGGCAGIDLDGFLEVM